MAEVEEDDLSLVAGSVHSELEVGFSDNDLTLNALPTSSGRMLTCLSDCGFGELFASARANVGLRAGRYMFEVSVVESRAATVIPRQRSAARDGGGGEDSSELPSPVVRVGFSTAGSPLLLCDDAPGCAYFDSEGFFGGAGLKERAGPSLARNATCAVVLNVEPGSQAANTMSLFHDGRRVSEPLLLPEAMRGKALYPAVTFRSTTLRVNFGSSPWQALPFRCRTVKQAAPTSCEIRSLGTPTSAKAVQEVLVPVGLPDEGLSHWLSDFLRKHRGFVEVSERMLGDWLVQSGIPKAAAAKTQANLLARLKSQALPMLHRNYVFFDVKANLLPEQRRSTLSWFRCLGFRKRAVVVMGELPAELKQGLGDVKQESSENARAEPDVPHADLAASFAEFTLPSQDEGFDSLTYDWRPAEACQELFQDWVRRQKNTLRVEDITPSKWFRDRWGEVQKLCRELRKKQNEWREVLEQLKAWRKEGLDASSESTLDDDRPTEVDSEDLDVMSVQNIDDIGSGEPLFAKFVLEDWSLLGLRLELHLLVHAFRRDMADPDRRSFHEQHLEFYYERYFQKTLELGFYGVNKPSELVKLVSDTVQLAAACPASPSASPVACMLDAVLPIGEPSATFVKLTERDRRDRILRLDAGEESAVLSFGRARPPTKPEAKAMPRPSARPAVPRRPQPPKHSPPRHLRHRSAAEAGQTLISQRGSSSNTTATKRASPSVLLAPPPKLLRQTRENIYYTSSKHLHDEHRQARLAGSHGPDERDTRHGRHRGGDSNDSGRWPSSPSRQHGGTGGGGDGNGGRYAGYRR